LRGWFLIVSRLVNGQIFPHLFQPFGADAFDSSQIIHTLERAIGFTRLKDFVCGRGPNARHLLQFRGAGGVQVDGVRRRFLLCIEILRRPEHKDHKEETKKSRRGFSPPRHGVIILG
jgi:hypothetical protein